jgi:hypothetical protein
VGPAPAGADWPGRALGAERSPGFTRAREPYRGSGGGGTMGSRPLSRGLVASGCRSAAGPWVRSRALRSPFPCVVFLFSLLLAAPGAWAAGYEVSGARGRKCMGWGVEPGVRSRGVVDVVCRCLVSGC